MGALTISGSTVDVQISALTPGVAATSLGKAEDAAHSSSDVGIMALAVRAAAAVDRSAGNTDGDYEPLSVDALGRLWTHEVGHRGVFLDTTAVSTSPAYTTLDLVGGIRTISNWALVAGGSAILESLTVFDVGNQKATLEFLFFSATPSGGTYTDNGAATFAAGDAALCIGRVTVNATDYITLGGVGVACLKNLMLPLPVTGTSLFALAFNVTTTPTYAATTNLHVAYGARY